ncbi:MAG: rhomboid family intramembrane serine protease [Candidatus Aenigmarchaeota archaeon]|nr:rhomboid family intramembrane serine protease [Candidatus Aenigmarchaeota archaeon]
MKMTYVLIIICIAVFIFIAAHSPYEQSRLLDRFGFSGDNFFSGNYWCIVTSIFVHGSVAHLVLNMIAFFFFGRALEREISQVEFLIIFLLGGIVGNLVSLLFYPTDELLIGASGAIFAIMGTVMIIKPFEFIFYPYLIPVPLALVGALYAAYTIIAFLFGGDSNIAYSAHLGGLAVGIIFGMRKGGMRGLMIVGILFIILFMTPILWKILGALDYSRILGTLFVR